MEERISHNPPMSIMDLVSLKKAGHEVTVDNAFEINEVELDHEEHPFQAFLFFCRFTGAIDGQAYNFKKCYSRGCTHNLCPHVSQAVMIANRYLQRDFVALEKAGINPDRKLFTLEGMLSKFEEKRDQFVSTLILDDYIHLAKEGNDIFIHIDLENFAAVENFENYKEKRLFFSANFAVTHLGEKHICQKCLSCCALDDNEMEIRKARDLANRRAAILYEEFDKAKIRYNRAFFE
ncbi:MAG: hypothetical protein H8E10_11655 [Desulfobacterales bacterium]|nr:hypothetical protein [Desulfobacterales bacterium]MBL7173184.1 hypothetical protein [Desulfobacteraceae bacterium]